MLRAVHHHQNGVPEGGVHCVMDLMRYSDHRTRQAAEHGENGWLCGAYPMLASAVQALSAHVPLAGFLLLQELPLVRTWPANGACKTKSSYLLAARAGLLRPHGSFAHVCHVLSG